MQRMEVNRGYRGLLGEEKDPPKRVLVWEVWFKSRRIRREAERAAVVSGQGEE